MMASHPLDSSDKRSALQQVLQSNTFVRGDQLRNFLRYICEMELAGRATELSEYLVGVEALGRPAGYSTADDSSVRRRAHALRQKLDEVYARELADACVRIDLPKGSYVPRFVPAPPRRREDEDVPAASPRETPAPPPFAAPVRAGWLAAAFVAGGLTAASALWLRAPSSSVDPVLRESWGAFARPGANVLICLATPFHLGILPYPDGPLPPKVSLLPRDPELLTWYKQRYPLPPEGLLGTHKATGPVRLGEVLGLVTVVRTLDRLGADYQIVAEKNMALPALRGRSLLLVGNPDYSFAASKLLERAEWTVGYDPARRDHVVRPPQAGGAAPVFVPTRDGEASLTEVFGLITVLPSEGAADAHPSQTVIVSCTHSAGCQAAMEFFSSAASVRGLRERFRKENRSGFPPAYQVVVRCRVQNSQAISGEYQSHIVLADAHPG